MEGTLGSVSFSQVYVLWLQRFRFNWCSFNSRHLLIYLLSFSFSRNWFYLKSQVHFNLCTFHSLNMPIKFASKVLQTLVSSHLFNFSQTCVSRVIRRIDAMLNKIDIAITFDLCSFTFFPITIACVLLNSVAWWNLL